MRHFSLAVGAIVLAACPAASAWAAFREPKTLTTSSSGSMGVVVLILVIALIVGVSLMSPRRTHQD